MNLLGAPAEANGPWCTCWALAEVFLHYAELCTLHPVQDINPSLLALYFRQEATLMLLVSAFTLSGRLSHGTLKHQGMKVRHYPLSLNAQVSRVPGVTFRKTRQFIGKILACNSGKRLNTWSISSMFVAGCMKQNFSGFLGSECAKSKKDLLRRRHKCTRATERGQLCQLLF